MGKPIKLDDSIPVPSVKYMPSPFAPDSSFHVQWDITKSYIPQKEIDKQLFELGEVKVTARKKDPIEKRRPYSEGFVKTSTQVKASNSFGDVRQLLRIRIKQRVTYSMPTSTDFPEEQ